jgi:hypothetical protein
MNMPRTLAEAYRRLKKYANSITIGYVVPTLRLHNSLNSYTFMEFSNV